MLDECDSPLPMRKSFTVVLKEDSVMRLWGTFPSRFTMYDYYYYVAYTGDPSGHVKSMLYHGAFRIRSTTGFLPYR